MTPGTRTAAPDLRATLEDATAQLLGDAGETRERAAIVRDLLVPLTGTAQEAEWVAQALCAAVELLDGVASGDADASAAFPRVTTLLEMVMQGESVSAATTGFVLSPAEFEELFPEFVAESQEHLEQVERALLLLETGQGDADTVDVIFRAFHTIKSTSAFLGFSAMSELAHNAETMLCDVRDGTRPLGSVEADLVLQAVDITRELLAQVGGAAGAPVIVPPAFDDLLRRLAAPVAAATAPAADSTQPAPSAVDDVAADVPRPDARQKRRSGDATLRLRTDRVDELIDLIGELVVAHSMVAQDALIQQFRHDPLAAKVAHSGKIVRELQKLGMTLRMVPLRPLFHRIERLARDVAKGAGKRIELTVDGADAEVDRSMVDLLADPLIHMIRNAIDHGIEAPDERTAAGKADVGRLRLAAAHVGGDVVIELSDDGRGLDADAIRDRAIDRGLVPAGAVLSAAESHALIFEAGFSTARAVTGLSGRGVGMDVVRRNIELLRGRVDIASTPGAGTTFRLRVPLTLAVTDGMLVRVGAERYIVPTADIQTCFRPLPQDVTTVAGAGELVTRHGTTMPLIRLHDRLGVGDAQTDATRALVVVVSEGGRAFGLLVDELLGQQQFVAKPVATGLEQTPGISGTAILSDGCVGLLLDPGGLVPGR